MVSKHSGRRTFLLATDTFMNSWVKPLLWITECFIVSQKKVNLFEIWVFRKFASLVECSQRREQRGVEGLSILSRLWKLKAKKYMFLYSIVTLIKAIKHIQGLLDMKFHKPGIDPQICFKRGCFAESHPPREHFLPLHSTKPCATFRRARDFVFCDSLSSLISHLKGDLHFRVHAWERQRY